MNHYMIAGLVLSALSGLCLSVFAVYMFRRKQTARYPPMLRRLPDVIYPLSLQQTLMEAYHESGSIEGMLQTAEREVKDKRIKRRFLAAVSYLTDSRYKDYETALYLYASDGSEAFRYFFEQLIGLEVRKTRGLPDRTK